MTSRHNTELREARVVSHDSIGFFRQPDGSWLEFSPAGLARFRFEQDGEDNGAPVIYDVSRNVGLRLDPVARTITEATPQGWRPLYDMSDAVRGPTPRAHRRWGEPSFGVTRVWFSGGGAIVHTLDGWAELSKVDGFPVSQDRWREQSRDADTILLAHGDTRMRIELEHRTVFLDEGDVRSTEPHWHIRAVDHF
ncbi:MAG: hypothetical protein ABUL73_04500 [Alphaproteobacteria bacterium]